MGTELEADGEPRVHGITGTGEIATRESRRAHHTLSVEDTELSTNKQHSLSRGGRDLRCKYGGLSSAWRREPRLINQSRKW
jgi:hypothetical protein